MTIDQYIDTISKRYKLGNATEHTFRGDLQQLMESIVPDIRATNEPKRQACGAPDYILTKKEIPVGYMEAKDIGDTDLSGEKKTGNKEQFDRYKASLNNIIFTDYLTFHLYREGQFVTKVSIGKIENGKIKPILEAFTNFTNLIKDFCIYISQTIRSSKQLAELMAGKARLLADVIEKSLNSDSVNQEDSSLKEQMQAFKEILIHDITHKSFADVYAQTIAYGMFAARFHDKTLNTFNRQEAAELIPKSNPFLRKLFGYIAGPDIDDRIRWIVDGLAEIFLVSNVKELLKDYGKSTKTEDPIVHFYETFLSEYDPNLRKSRGVWYTPQPVVDFIVRAVDEVLRSEFDLPQGLSDNSKIKIKVDVQGKKIEQEVHKVQILDPATGTGTFLAQVVKQIYPKFEKQKGVWNSYVENHLIPRLHGFELLMASYAMAHLQLDLLLSETGFTPIKNQRLRIYLTNSLEEHHPDTGTLFASWLSQEANEANYIKRDTPVMVVLGNPPYAVSSTNKSKWIQNLIADYKKDLNERKINLDDDYIKFIRYGQHYIDKNESGILAYISNNSFIDGITHRQMRKCLLESFDKIYILDLHGNAKKKEVCSDGSPDQNVFDIMQGVSINIFLKTGKKKKNQFGKVFHFSIRGKREEKYIQLHQSTVSTIPWTEIHYTLPYYFFVPKDFSQEEEYKKGFKIDELFLKFSSGVETQKDIVNIFYSMQESNEVHKDFSTLNIDQLILKHNLKDGRDWKVKNAKDDILKTSKKCNMIHYRPFDIRYTNYTGITKGIMAYPRYDVMQHFLKTNIGLIVPRQTTQDFKHVFISKHIIEGSISASAKLFGTGCIFPLYLYSNSNKDDKQAQTGMYMLPIRTPNLNMDIVDKFAKILGLEFGYKSEER